MRNNKSLTNNLLPIIASSLADPKGGFVAQLHADVDRYFANMDRLVKTDPNRLRVLLHDLRLLCTRLSSEDPLLLAAESKGGNLDSNLTMLLPLLTFTLFVLTAYKGKYSRKNPASQAESQLSFLIELTKKSDILEPMSLSFENLL